MQAGASYASRQGPAMPAAAGASYASRQLCQQQQGPATPAGSYASSSRGQLCQQAAMPAAAGASYASRQLCQQHLGPLAWLKSTARGLCLALRETAEGLPAYDHWQPQGHVNRRVASNQPERSTLAS